MSIKLALGASRGRLIRQLLTEATVLSVIGASLGLLMAVWGVALLKAVAPVDTPRLAGVHIDAKVLLFTVAACFTTAIACGLIPALQSSRTDLQQALKESSRSTIASHSRFARNAMVVSEIALSIVLLIGAGLLVRSFLHVQHVDTGLDVDRLVTMQVSSVSARYPNAPKILSFYKQLVDSVNAAPGVESSAVSSALSLGGGGFYLGRVFLEEGKPEPPAGPDTPAQWNVISPGYFHTSGTALLEGRDFDERDRTDSTPVIIINRTMARRMFGTDDPLGKRIRSWRDENKLREIVGVVEDVSYFGRDEKPQGLVYVPHTQNVWRSMALTVRTHGDPAGVIAAIREQIASVDRELAIANLATMTTIVDRSIAPRRASMLLVLVFGVLAGVLAVIGIYGVLSYTVAQRAQEIGVRIALGAQKRDVLGLVLGHGFKLTVAGVVIGLAGAYALTRLMTSLLYNVGATDLLTFVAVSFVLSCVAMAACFVPALRATRTDPMIALRYE